MGKSVKKIASVALPIAASFIPGVGPALGAALGGAAAGAINGGGLKGIALGAASGYAGNALGSSIGGSITSSLGKAGASNALTNSIANSSIGNFSLGNAISGIAGPATGSSLIGGALGKFAGNSIASSVTDTLTGGSQESDTSTPSGPAPYSPTRDPAMQLPSSLSSFGSLAPEQQTSSLATQGVYGGGLGPQEEDFFSNMINRKLIDESGAVDQNLDDISPIESSYLSQMGLGGYGNASSLLEMLSKRRNNGVQA
jgi:hypothetical protein